MARQRNTNFMRRLSEPAAYRLASSISWRLVDGVSTFPYIYVVAPTEFRWIEWNREHATKHGCPIDEIESVVRNAKHGFPRHIDREKWEVIGRGIGGRVVEVVY